jgi:hypothetical protein
MGVKPRQQFGNRARNFWPVRAGDDGRDFRLGDEGELAMFKERKKDCTEFGCKKLVQKDAED